MAKQQLDKTERRGTPLGMRDTLKKATTEMLVLFMLRQKPMYTYEMTRSIEQATDGKLTYNTLYLAVHRLLENAYIYEAEKCIEDGRARIYLAPTEAGLEYYRALHDEFFAFTDILKGLLEKDGAL